MLANPILVDSMDQYQKTLIVPLTDAQYTLGMGHNTVAHIREGPEFRLMLTKKGHLVMQRRNDVGEPWVTLPTEIEK